MWYMRLVESDLLPDWLIRTAIRAIIEQSTRRKYRASREDREAERLALLDRLRQSPIAVDADQANRQHYEVPAEFFQLVLGTRKKYSCCYWPRGVNSLDQAEDAMLQLTCERAQLTDGMDVLDLGCGWGSFCLWAAEHYPNSRVVAVSNSRTQKEYIDAQCRQRNIRTVETITADVTHLQLDRRFDRVVSIEMFEHMKNYERLMSNLADCLKPGGKLFVHIFSHREFAYEYDAANPSDWMARTFFTGGLMPSDDLLLHFQRDLVLSGHWRISGLHYGRTLRAWLDKLDRHESEVRKVLAGAYGAEKETLWLVNWRLFFMVCEETWNLRQGDEYLISHYLFDIRQE
jgi:cyclopropane-fatty-acyl-phospholipid synthase